MSAKYQATYDGWWYPSVFVEIDKRLSWTFGARFALADEAKVRITDEEAISVMKTRGLANVAASERVEVGWNYVEGSWGKIKEILSSPSGELPPPSLMKGFTVEVIEECWHFPSLSITRGFATLERISPLISEYLDLREGSHESGRQQKCLV